MSPFHTKQSKQRKQERDLMNLLRTKRRREAEHEAREVARYDTWEYLDHFVKTSPEWCQLKDQITICWDHLPPLEELLSYGSLDKTSGTLKCRKLFKAAVIWEDLGCSLWEELSSKPSTRHQQQQHDSSLATVHEQDSLTLDTTAMSVLSHAVSRCSRSSRESRSPSRSRHTSSDRGDAESQSQASTYNYSLRSPVRPPLRNRTMTMPLPEEKDPLHGIPRFFTTHRTNSLKAV